jgi:tRNA(adenine34) deaminase
MTADSKAADGLRRPALALPGCPRRHACPDALRHGELQLSTLNAATFEPAMRRALREAAAAAQAAGAAGADVPVGAVITGPDGTVIATGRNRREADGDPTAHAEMIAIREAARVTGGWRLTGLTLVVTLEPCTMCAGAITLSRLDRVVFGALDPKGGAVGSLWDVVTDRRLNHRPEVIGGVLAGDCAGLLREFFSARRRISSQTAGDLQPGGDLPAAP